MDCQNLYDYSFEGYKNPLGNYEQVFFVDLESLARIRSLPYNGTKIEDVKLLTNFVVGTLSRVHREDFNGDTSQPDQISEVLVTRQELHPHHTTLVKNR